MDARLTGDSCFAGAGCEGTAGAGVNVPDTDLDSAGAAGVGVADLVTVCANVLVVSVAMTRAAIRRVLNIEISGKCMVAFGKRSCFISRLTTQRTIGAVWGSDSRFLSIRSGRSVSVTVWLALLVLRRPVPAGF